MRMNKIYKKVQNKKRSGKNRPQSIKFIQKLTIL